MSQPVFMRRPGAPSPLATRNVKLSILEMFVVQTQPNGDILLSPVVIRHEREAWLFDNPEALASVHRGLEQSARGKGKSLGSFTQYADLDIDEEEG
ncbi:hypothetical protein BH11ARM2_BH11ARM2_02320 [soil metagenome]